MTSFAYYRFDYCLTTTTSLQCSSQCRTVLPHPLFETWVTLIYFRTLRKYFTLSKGQTKSQFWKVVLTIFGTWKKPRVSRKEVNLEKSCNLYKIMRLSWPVWNVLFSWLRLYNSYFFFIPDLDQRLCHSACKMWFLRQFEWAIPLKQVSFFYKSDSSSTLKLWPPKVEWNWYNRPH